MFAMGAVGAVVAAIAALYLTAGNQHFSRDGCDRLDTVLNSRVVGQELAIDQFVEAVCEHLRKENRGAVGNKPLVVSVHGPPGVGKTLTHTLAARALYGLEGAARSTEVVGPDGFWSGWGIPRVQSSLECPGRGCAGYKVLYGMDFVESKRDQQRQALRNAIVDHIKAFQESFVVVEEYDKLDCGTRSMLRQLVMNPDRANVSMGKSIFLLESNLGMFELQTMLEAAGGANKVSAEAVHHKLKDLIFDHWRGEGCETFYDTLKNTNFIDLYIPYFSLEKKHLKQILEMRLGEASTAAATQGFHLQWDRHVVDFLLGKVEFDGNYPVDGAKDVDMAMRYVSRALRKLKGMEELSHGGQSLFGRRQSLPRVVLKADKDSNILRTEVAR
ncbi:unnamed protein product [Ostreobium quekettii]|uniref:AAA+ ATPase domain-containing protein n=1 Tax=Ostreobium quekettii TaxID=121088 RepID=A0A8S1JAH0_9CHLO|nr:unnamed protein product [Ostreobium quekettii]|eukprot:evm.model.scf_1759.1 EVM.evm.TU.scf_1759.1   scf_1759:321-3116(+)